MPGSGRGGWKSAGNGNSLAAYSTRLCATNVLTAMEVRNCARDEGRSLEAGRQGQASNHRKLRRSKAVVVSVAEKAGLDPVR